MFYILLLFLNSFQELPQVSKNFELLNTASGLSNNIVFDVYEDKEGFIWMATDNGLNRYDGYAFKKFYHNPSDSTSLSSNIIRKILEDKDGNLWIGTKNGINLYDRKNEKFKRYNIKKNSDFIVDTQQMQLDKNGKIWFNNLKKVGYFDVKTKEFEVLNSNFYSHCMTLEKENVVWIQSKWGELRSVEVDSLKFRKRESHKTLFEKQIHYGKYSNSLWLPEVFLNHSLDVPFKIIPKLPRGIEPFRLKEIDKQTLLIGSNEGLFEYNHFTKFLKRVDLDGSLSALTRQIRSIYKDKNGGLWIGTLGGVFHYDYYKNNFEHVDLNKDGTDVVMGLEAGVNGVYANTLGKGIYYKSNHSKKFEKLNKGNVISDQELFVWRIKEIPESEYPLWMSTNVGLVCYNSEKNKKIKIDLPVINGGVEISFDIYNTNKNYVWVGSMGSIHKVDKKSGKLIKTYLINEGKNRSTIQKIIEFNEQLIFATESDGLFLFDEKTGTSLPIKLKDNSKEETSVFKTYIWDLHVFQDVLWIGTNRGLFKLKAGENVTDTLFNNNQIIFSIEDDKKGSLWLGTERGLINYKIETEKIHHYGKVNGLKNIEFNRRSVIKTNDGRLWFGGVNGITVFDPQRIQENPVIPPVYVTKIRVITADSTFSIPHRNQKIVLPHNQNTIELNYVALNYTNSSQNKYKYQMIGHDPNWVNDQTRKARYAQLPTGKYTFQVTAANNDGVWNEIGDQLEIQVLPPYWETWWFRSCLALLIGGIIYTIYKYRVRRLLEIERMKLRIASDLHDEVGSGLSSIALTSDILEQQVNKGEVKSHLISRITNNARYLASTLDDIIWLINPEKEALGDFLIKAKTIAQELLPDQYLNFEDNINDLYRDKLLTSNQKRNLLLFVKEAINNIAKHANSKKVSISFKMKDHLLFIEIVDDGKGFDLACETTGSGLSSMRNRARVINAKIEIFSEKDVGTHVVLSGKIP